MASRADEMKRYLAQQARSRKRQARARQQGDSDDYWENIRTTGKDVGKELATEAAIGAATGGVGLLGRALIKGGRKMHKTYKAGKAAERAAAATKLAKKAKKAKPKPKPKRRPGDQPPVFKSGPKSATQAAQRGRVMTTRKAQAIVEGRKLTTKGSGEYAEAVKFLRDQAQRKGEAKAAKIRPKAPPNPKKGQDAAERAMEKRRAYMESAEYRRNKAKRAAKPKKPEGY